MKRIFLVLFTVFYTLYIFPANNYDNYKFSVLVGASKCHKNEYQMGIYAEGDSTNTYDRLVIPSPWLTTLIIPRHAVAKFYEAYDEVVKKYYDWSEKIKYIENLKSFSKKIPLPFAIDGCYCSENNLIGGKGQKISTIPQKTSVEFVFFVDNFGEPMIAVNIDGLQQWQSLCFYLKGDAIEEFKIPLLLAESRYLADPKVQADALLN